MLWFGFYRLFSVKDFTAVVFTSYCLELVFQAVPLVFIMGINNGIMQDSGLDPKPIVDYALGLTIIVVIELFIQIVITGFEVKNLAKNIYEAKEAG